jgi:hypothetical protein
MLSTIMSYQPTMAAVFAAMVRGDGSPPRALVNSRLAAWQ